MNPLDLYIQDRRNLAPNRVRVQEVPSGYFQPHRPLSPRPIDHLILPDSTIANRFSRRRGGFGESVASKLAGQLAALDQRQYNRAVERAIGGRTERLIILYAWWLPAERLGGFTGGGIAIIITILVLEIHVPVGHDFATEGWGPFLEEIEREIMVYFLSFLLIMVFWLQHHVMFHYVERVNRTVIWLNGMFLFLLSLSPFTTSLAAEYRGIPFIEAVFGVNGFLSGIALFAMWAYASRNPYLLRKPIEPGVRRSMGRRILVAPAVILLGLGASLIDFRVATFLYFCIPFFYLSHWIADTRWHQKGDQ